MQKTIFSLRELRSSFLSDRMYSLYSCLCPLFILLAVKFLRDGGAECLQKCASSRFKCNIQFIWICDFRRYKCVGNLEYDLSIQKAVFSWENRSAGRYYTIRCALLDSSLHKKVVRLKYKQTEHYYAWIMRIFYLSLILHWIE